MAEHHDAALTVGAQRDVGKTSEQPGACLRVDDAASSDRPRGTVLPAGRSAGDEPLTRDPGADSGAAQVDGQPLGGTGPAGGAGGMCVLPPEDRPASPPVT